MNTSLVSGKDDASRRKGAQEGQHGQKWRALKVVLAFVFGMVSFMVLFQLADALRPVLVVGLGAVGFLVCQYLLSRGNPQAARTDWGMVLAMNALPVALFAGSLMVGVTKDQTAEMLKGLPVVVLGLGCSYAGAVLAGRTARK